MKIPNTRIIRTESRCELTADDGHCIVAVKYPGGQWKLLNEFSSAPSCDAHFSLRRQFIEGLNGVRP